MEPPTPSEEAARMERQSLRQAAAERTLAVSDILHERSRQIACGHTPAKDAQLTLGELTAAAEACIAVADDAGQDGEWLARTYWPFAYQTIPKWSEGRRRLLVKAAALILAELERLPRREDTLPSAQTLTIEKGGN